MEDLSRPTFEGLPVELQISILFNIDDLDSLRSLVFASPTYHRAYQLVRQELLYTLLQRSYNGLVDIADAVAAVRSRGLYAVKLSNRAKIIAVLDSRRRSEEIRRLRLSSWPFPDEPADIEETTQLLHLHRMATFLLDDYSRTAARPEWMDLEEWKNEIPLTLSRMEQRRFLRAFYRMQIYGNIFGHIEIPLGADDVEEENDWFADTRGRTPTFTDEETWRLFFGPMAPWEVEEFSCFWQHCYHRWTDPYREIAKSLAAYAANGVIWFSDLPPEERPPLNRCGLDVDHLPVHENEQRKILAHMVPTFLVKMLREPDFRTRRDLLLANTVILNHSFVDYWPKPNWEDPGALPLLYPADRFNFGTDVSGLKAYLETLPPHERPNIAWTQRWLDAALEYPQVFEDMYSYAPYCRCWEWGYAIWDEERLIEWDAMDHLELP
ncbi:hypothetical protein IFM51744_08517 [Aspergillus udagawae]|nr:hypothetical protein IFM51744_08517 [Aspergillus udagawae]